MHQFYLLSTSGIRVTAIILWFVISFFSPTVVKAQCDIGGTIIEITDFPYHQNALSTCGAGNNLNDENVIACGNSNYINSEDLVLTFSVPHDSLYHITMTNASESWTSIYVYNGCPLNGEDGTCVDNSSSSSSDRLLALELEAGNTYYMVISRWYDECFDFDLSIDLPLNCPEPGTPGWETITLPFSQTGLTTCGMGNDFLSFNTTSCGNNNYLNSDEMVYIFEAPTSDYYHFSLTNTTESWTSMKLYNDCPYLAQEGECVSQSGSSGSDKIMGVDLVEGQTYYLVISRWYEDCFDFDLTIDLPVTCPETDTTGWETVSLPFEETGLTTCGMGDDFQSYTTTSCGSNNYLNSEDMVYIFEAPTSNLYHFSLTNATESWTSMKLYDGCPYLDQGGECVSQISSSGSGKVMEVDLEQGQTYYLIISRYYEGCFEFDLTIDAPETCPDTGSTGWPEITLPFAETNLTTCGMGDDLQSFNTISCGSNSYYNGEEIVFIFEAPSTDFYHFSLTNGTTSWSSMKLHDGCPLLNHETTCLGSSTSASGNHILEADLVEGQTYYLMVSNSSDECFEFDLSIDIPETCPEPGSTGWPEITLPFAETNLTTCGMGDDLQSFNTINCGSNSYYNGEEIVFIFEAPTSDLYHISLTNGTTSWSSMKLHDGCPLLNHETTCLGSSTSASGNHILEADLVEGQTYYLMVSNSSNDCFDFDLSILVPQECPEPGDPGWEAITLPYAGQNQTTCGMGDDLQSFNTVNCGSNSYFNGEEMIYIFAAPASDTWYFTLANTTTNFTSLKLYDGCPLMGQGTQCVADASGLDAGKLLEATLEEGQTYYLVIGSSSADCFDFDLVIDLYPLLNCPDDMTVCSNEPIVLNMVTPQGGEYSGEGVSFDENENLYVFDPAGLEGQDIAITYMFGGFEESSCGFTISVLDYYEPNVPVALAPEDGSSVTAPITFSWEVSEHASSYDLYIWRSTNDKPQHPTVSGLTETEHTHDQYLNTTYLYKWQIVAVNNCYQIPGEIRSFSFNPLPDLVVTQVTVPASGVAGSESEISFTVENTGEGEPGWMPWTDKVYLSEEDQWNPDNVILTDSFENVGHPAEGENYIREAEISLPDTLQGQFYVYVFTDAENDVSETDDSNNILRSDVPISISFPPYPDLAISNVSSISGASVIPGENLTIGWEVENIGDADAAGGWSQRVALVSGEQIFILGFAQYGATLPPSGVLSESATFMVPKSPAMEGDVNLQVTLIPNPELVEVPNSEANNTSMSEESITLERQLFLSLSPGEIIAGAPATITATLLRSGNTAEDLAISLEVSDENALILPESLTIPAQQGGITFEMQLNDEHTFTGTTTLNISAQAEGYGNGEAELMVSPNDVPALSVHLDGSTYKEGETLQITVERNMASEDEVLVTLVSNAPERAFYPYYLTLAVGQTTKTVEVTLNQDEFLELPQTVKITASADGYAAGMFSFSLLDNLTPQFQLEILPETISPLPNEYAAWGTITLTEENSVPLTFKILTETPGKLILPAEVVIPPGETQAGFSIGVPDNAIKEGSEEIKVTAALFLENCNCFMPESAGGTSSKNIMMTSDVGPMLTITANPQLVADGTDNAGTLQISIQEPAETDIQVSISLAPSGIIEMQESITIAQGTTMAEVSFSSVAGAVPEGETQTVSVLAEAEEFNTGSQWILVSNASMPDLLVNSLVLSENEVAIGDEIEIEIDIFNQGLNTAANGTDVMIYLSETPSADSQAMLQSILLTPAPIEPGASLTMTGNLNLSGYIGDYYVIVELNKQRYIHELLYANNFSEAKPLTIQPGYYAQAMVDESVYSVNDSINIHGFVRDLNEQPLPSVEVDVYVVVKGTRRMMRTTSDENGDFSVYFKPVSGEGGDYYVGAGFPGANLDEAQDEFIIPGLRYPGDPETWDLVVDEPHTESFTIENLSSMSLSGVDAEVLSAQEGLEITFNGPISIPGNSTAELSYTVVAHEVSENMEFEKVKLRLTSTEGATHRFDAWSFSKSEEGYITANPGTMETTVLQGYGNIREIAVTNIGEAETGMVVFDLPDIGWLTMISADTLENIPPQGTAVFTMRINPGADVPLNVPVTGNFAINAENANSITLPFIIEPVSENTGDLQVDVVNEYTYNTDEAPHVEGAQVSVRHMYTGEVVAEGITGSDGLVLFEEIPEGYYNLVVYKELHETYFNTIEINMGQVNEVLAFISFQAVSYFWEVVPTLIEDEYDINLIAQFETQVPAPVVVLDAPEDMPDLSPGEFFPFVITITNYGLITANNVSMNFSDSGPYVFSYLFDEMDLPAQSTIQIPVLMELDPDAGDKNNPPCWYYIEVPYEYECGPVTITGMAKEMYWLGGPHCSGSDLVGQPGGGSSAGATSGGGSGAALVGYFAGCDCAFEQIEFILSCGLCNIPPVAALCIPYNIYSCFTGVYEGCYGNIMQLSCAENVVRCSPDPYSSAAFCIKDLLTDPCLLGPPPGGPGGPGGPDDKGIIADCPFATDPATREALSGLQEQAEILLELQEIAISWAYELYGDSVWFEAPEAELQYFWDYLETLDLDSHLTLTPELINHTPANITENQLLSYIQRRNNTVDMENEVDYDETNVVDIARIDSLNQRTHEIELEIQSMGYIDSYDMLEDLYTNLHQIYSGGIIEVKNEKMVAEQPDTKNSSAAVCARVTLQFSQSLTMTREAFQGTLTLSNGSETDAIEQIHLDLEILDENGVNSNHLFEIVVLSMDNITGIEGNGALESGETGTVVVQFIPTRQAAPTNPVFYSFGGNLSYMDPFAQDMANQFLYPVTLQVNPSPDLYIDYFMQRDILGDDPFTDAIEPSIPAELAVMINNQGAGTAMSVNIESAQPEIIDNDKGLLIDFEIIGSNLSGEPTQLGLMNIDFGDIEPGETAIGQWWFTSTLLGHFIKYEVSIVHLNSYDNPDLSLVSEVNVHELIRSVRVYGDNDDGIDDFLVNNIPELNDYPDHLFYSHGGSDPVVVSESAHTDGEVTLENLTVELTVEPSSTGWNYARLPDPGNGNFRIVSCTREDGLDIPLKNIWLTHVRIPDGGLPVYVDNMHLLDIFSSQEEMSYTVVFEFIDQDLPAVTEINGVPEGIADDPVTHLEVVFNKPINPETFTYEDMTLRNQGGDNLMDSLVTIDQLDDHKFEVDLTGKTDLFGLYSLIVQAAGIQDIFGNSGEVGKQVFWIQGMNVPAIIRFFNYPQVSEEAIDSIYVYFNMPLVTGTFSAAQIALVMAGGDEINAESLEVTQIDQLGRLFSISGLAPLNQEEGIYELTVKVTEITGESGENGFMDQSVQWVIGNEPDFIADAGPDGEICAYDSFSLAQAYTNAFDSSWSGGDGFFSEEDGVVYYTPGSNDIAAGEAELCLTALDSGGNPVATDCMLLTIHPIPEVTLPDYEPVCINTPAFEITGGTPGGGIYSGDFLDENNIFDPNAAGPGVYTFIYTYTSATGCTGSDTTEITVNTLPEFDCPAFDPVCQGSDAVEFAGPGVYINSDGEEVPSFETHEPGIFEFTYLETNDYGCTDSCFFSIEVLPLPAEISAISGPEEVCLESASVLYTIEEAEHAESYIWTLPEGATGESNTHSIEVDFGPNALSGQISVQGVNNCGTGIAAVLDVTVYDIPETPVITLLDDNVLESDAPEGNQWYNQDGIIEGATGQQYVVTEDGDYHVVVTLEGCNSEMSNVVTVIVTGIDVTEFDADLRVYPNPFTSEIVFEYDNAAASISYEIMNLAGQMVYSGSFSEKTTINTAQFVPGFYVIKFEDGTNISFRKVVKD